MNADIVEKLQKILALANCKGATQGEVEAAMARAGEIARKHGIELASLPQREDSKSKLAPEIQKNDTLKTSTRYEHPYHMWVMKTLEEVFGVRFLFNRARLGTHPYLMRIYIIGEATDVAIACAMFPWLESMFPKILGEAVKAGRLTRSFPDQNGCYAGLWRGIVAANKREEEKLSAQDRSTWALVVRDKTQAIQQFMDDHMNVNKKQKESRKRYSSEGVRYGQERGAKINLRQMNGSSNSGEIGKGKSYVIRSTEREDNAFFVAIHSFTPVYSTQDKARRFTTKDEATAYARKELFTKDSAFEIVEQ